MTLTQPTLALFDEPPVHWRERVVGDGTDKFAWLRARSRGVTATDVARLSSQKAVQKVALEKLLGTSFRGNQYTEHGLAREPHIGRWANSVYGMQHSGALFHADGNRDHLATPDGLRERGGILELCEIKTTAHAWRGIPRHYLRQVWWQQYVLGAERTLVVWEQHDRFVPVRPEPRCEWVDRDDNEIHALVGLANLLLAAMKEPALLRRPC